MIRPLIQSLLIFAVFATAAMPHRALATSTCVREDMTSSDSLFMDTKAGVVGSAVYVKVTTTFGPEQWRPPSISAYNGWFFLRYRLDDETPLEVSLHQSQEVLFSVTDLVDGIHKMRVELWGSNKLYRRQDVCIAVDGPTIKLF
jgi:hypothetical protein